MNVSEIQSKIIEIGMKASTVSDKFSAKMTLYIAASRENNTREMDSLRDELHAHLDILLDYTATQQMLVRQMQEEMHKKF